MSSSARRSVGPARPGLLGATSGRRRIALRRSVATLPPLALALLGAEVARGARDGGAAAETIALALWAALVLLPLAIATLTGARPFRRRLDPLPWIVPGATLAAALPIALLPRAGAARGAYVEAVLVGAVAAVFAHRAGRREPPLARDPWATGALALAAAFVAHGHRLWTAPRAATTAIALVALPAAAVATVRFASRFLARGREVGRNEDERFALGCQNDERFALECRNDERFSLVLGGAVLLAPLARGESLGVLGAIAIAVAAAGSRSALARPAAAALAVAAIATLLAGSFPWLRPRPLATTVGALAAPRVEAVPLGRASAVLAAASPRFEVATAGEARALLVDSYLTNSTALPCGTPLVRVAIRGEADDDLWSGTLVVGRDSAEWAAGRADVAAALACAPPPPFARWIAAGGTFLGRTSRATLRFPGPLAARSVVFERDAALPGVTSIAIFAVSVER